MNHPSLTDAQKYLLFKEMLLFDTIMRPKISLDSRLPGLSEKIQTTFLEAIAELERKQS